MLPDKTGEIDRATIELARSGDEAGGLLGYLKKWGLSQAKANMNLRLGCVRLSAICLKILGVYIFKINVQLTNEASLPSSRIEDLSTPSKQMRVMERQTVIEKGLKELSDRDQSVLRMRHEEGLSFVEIGKVLDVSGDAARMLWGRAIDGLKTNLVKYGDL